MVAPLPPDRNDERAALGAKAVSALPDEVQERAEQLFREELATNPYEEPERVERLREERLGLLRQHAGANDAEVEQRNVQSRADSEAAAAELNLPASPVD